MSEAQNIANAVAPQAPIEATNEQSTEAVKEEKSQDLYAPKFAALSRKEKMVKQAEASLKQREADLAQKMKELEERSKQSSDSSASLEEQLKANPLKFLRDKGITMEQLVQMQLNDENPTTDMKMERMRSDLESKTLKRIEELEKQLKEKEENQAKQQYEKAVEAYKIEVDSFIKKSPDAYELIIANNANDLVFQVAEEYYNSTDKVLEIKDAADAVEAHLEEEAKKILELKKFKTSPKTEQTQKIETAPTLSNTQASEVPKNGSRNLSNEESVKEAAKLLRWIE